jgi:hypothetical protein
MGGNGRGCIALKRGVEKYHDTEVDEMQMVKTKQRARRGWCHVAARNISRNILGASSAIGCR